MREIHRLIEQLSPPLERPSWPNTTARPPQQVMVLPDDDSSFALVVWVKFGEGAITLRPVPGPASPPIALQRLAAATGRQRLTVNQPPEGTSHLLVMGWTRERKAPPIWGQKPFDHPLTPSADGLDAWLSTVAPDVVQAALTALLAQSPDAIESSLLALPEPDPMALATPPREQHAYSLRTFSTAIDPESAPSLPAAWTPPLEPANPAPLEPTSLVFASCQYPAGLLDHRVASASFRRMEDTAAKQGPLGALLMLGDQIYADATYGILDPSSTGDRYEQLYIDLHSALKQYPTLSKLGQQTEPRLYVTPDDHEIRDNWEPGGPDRNHDDKKVALEAFERLSLSRLPAKQRSGGYWGAVDVGGGHQVFMLDTRTEREPRPWGPGEGPHAPHIIGLQQRQALEQWLQQRQRQDGTGPVSPKFISSSVWLLPRQVGRAEGPEGSAQRSDSWDGYPASLQGFLGFIASERIHGVVMLCGDAHLAGHTRVDLQHGGHAIPLHVLHAPGLYAPFPFANGQPHQYRCADDWQWKDSNGSISCHVESDLWALGDGFVHLSLVPVDNTWEVRARFDAGPNRSRQAMWTVT